MSALRPLRWTKMPGWPGSAWGSGGTNEHRPPDATRKLPADLQEPACTAKLAVPEAAPGACACSRRTPHEPAGQRGEQPRISRMTAPERLRLNHCSTTPGKTGAAPALHGDE